MEGFKINTAVHGEMVELDPLDAEGDARLIVTEFIGGMNDDFVSAEVYLNAEQRRQLVQALLKLDGAGQ